MAICGTELAVEVVDGLTGGLGYRASGILHRASNLIRNTLIGKIGIAGEVADALFELAGDVGCLAANALL